MKLNASFVSGLCAGVLFVPSVSADERRFTYTYEPETLPAGAFELEHWMTLRTQRNRTVGRDNFNRWDLRQELEYGVTDRYTVALYLNERAQSYRNPTTGADVSEFTWKGVSLENRYNVLNPAEHAVGLTLYLEGRYSGEEAELEQKLIFGQRHGDWKWALNLIHETEWEDNLSAVEAVLGASVGVAYDFAKRWSIGLELFSHTVWPEYGRFESSALFLGPVLSYRREKWWAALSVLPQIAGWNFTGNPDGDRRFELSSHERLNVRLLFGFNF